MFTDLNVFRTAFAMAAHAGHRQAIVAQNVANADTPGYRARDIAPFTDYFNQQSRTQMLATRAGHTNAAGSSTEHTSIQSDDPSDPNENSVSIELEMMKAVDAKRQHDRALAIYRSSMTILRSSLGRSGG